MVDRRSNSDLPHKDEWRTPPEFVAAVEWALWNRSIIRGRFWLDPCAALDNHLRMPEFFTKETDGLLRFWSRGLFRPVFVNPPFSQKERWIIKSRLEAKNGSTVVILLETATDSRLFHEVISKSLVFLLRRRVSFLNDKLERTGYGQRGHILSIWGPGIIPCIHILDLRPEMEIKELLGR